MALSDKQIDTIRLEIGFDAFQPSLAPARVDTLRTNQSSNETIYVVTITDLCYTEIVYIEKVEKIIE